MLKNKLLVVGLSMVIGGNIMAAEGDAGAIVPEDNPYAIRKPIYQSRFGRTRESGKKALDSRITLFNDMLKQNSETLREGNQSVIRETNNHIDEMIDAFLQQITQQNKNVEGLFRELTDMRHQFFENAKTTMDNTTEENLMNFIESMKGMLESAKKISEELYKEVFTEAGKVVEELQADAGNQVYADLRAELNKINNELAGVDAQ